MTKLKLSVLFILSLCVVLFAQDTLNFDPNTVGAIGFITPFLSIVIGISIVSGLMHFFFLLGSKREKYRVYFILLCFFGAWYIWGDLRAYYVSSVPELVSIYKEMIQVGTIWWIILYFFVYALLKSEMNTLRLLIVLSAVVVVNIYNIYSPASAYYVSISGLHNEVLPWGETFVKPDAEAGWVLLLIYITSFLIAIDLTCLSIRKSKTLGKTDSITFIMFLPLYLLFYNVVDMLIDFGYITFIYIGELFSFTVILLMNFYLTKDYQITMDKFWHLFHQTFQHVIILNSKGVITAVNNTALQDLNEKREDVIGTSFFSSPWGSSLVVSRETTSSSILEQVLSGEFVEYDMSLLNKDGKRVTFDISMKKVFKPDAFSAVIVEGRNVSSRINMEEEIRDARIKLQSLAIKLSSVEEREKRNIAGFLHDDIGKQLPPMRELLEELKKQSDNTGDIESIEYVRQQIAKLFMQLRTYIYNMNPSLLYDLGLPQAVKMLGDELAQNYGFSFEIFTDGDFNNINNDIAFFVYRAIQEFMVNTVKYAQASEVICRIKKENDTIGIEISDNGIGFNLEILNNARLESGFGLFSIREKINYLGGTFSITSKPGNGVQLSISVPM